VDVPGKLGRYEILERVGRGGMGMLYRGRDTVLDREVAIKVMSGDFSADEAARGRFFREARAAARLQHRNIVTIYEFAEDEHGTPYIAMEFLRGRSLAARLSQDPPLTLVQKLDILVQLCTGLHYAHEQGIVHRDVKPGNIWLMDDGTVKLLDFGIAKIAASTMTHVGSVLGSAAYMSPEQVAGREIDGRADVFSAGVVLYEMLARRKPFEGDGPTAVMMKIIKDEPAPIRQYAPDIPTALVHAVTKSLQKDADRRFMHAGDLGAELRLIRLALERTVETIIEDPEAVSTMFAPVVTAALGSGSTAEASSADPLGGALLPGPSEHPGERASSGGRFATWVAVAAVAVAGVLGAIVLVQRSGGSVAQGGLVPHPAAATVAGDRNRSTPDRSGTASASTSATVKLVTDPEGASILINGDDVGLRTPADVAVSDLQANTVRVTKRGFKPAEVRAADTQLHNGVVRVKMEAASAGVLTVALSGGYPFEVLDGGRVISRASTRHELNLPGPKLLRLRASEYLLDVPFKAESSSGRMSYNVPEPGRVTIRTPLETCKVSIGGRDYGFPPITDQKIAAGNHKVQLNCPDGDTKTTTVSVAAGESVREVIR
jgi:serine/threonine protein kinase